MATSETTASWNTFFADLVARGLGGVRLVTSDAHAGLVGAIAANLPGAAWQRCRTHYSANLMAVCPKSMWPAVKAMLHSVYDQPTTDAVNAQFDRLLEYTEGRLPEVANHLGGAREDLLAFTAFPDDVWRQIWSNNPIERLNKEIKRRADVVEIFPNPAAFLRLATSVVIDQHDEWQVGRRYLSESSMAELRRVIAAKQHALDASSGYDRNTELVDHCDGPDADPNPTTSRGTIPRCCPISPATWATRRSIRPTTTSTPRRTS